MLRPAGFKKPVLGLAWLDFLNTAAFVAYLFPPNACRRAHCKFLLLSFSVNRGNWVEIIRISSIKSVIFFCWGWLFWQTRCLQSINRKLSAQRVKKEIQTLRMRLIILLFYGGTWLLQGGFLLSTSIRLYVYSLIFNYWAPICSHLSIINFG